jgi:hypothetical protein
MTKLAPLQNHGKRPDSFIPRLFKYLGPVVATLDPGGVFLAFQLPNKDPRTQNDLFGYVHYQATSGSATRAPVQKADLYRIGRSLGTR